MYRLVAVGPVFILSAMCLSARERGSFLFQYRERYRLDGIR